MNFDLNKITEEGIIINQVVSFDDNYLLKSQIKELKDVFVTGKIYYNITGEVIFNGKCKGNMKLVDSNTGEYITYPFDISIDEILMESDKIDEKLRTNTQNSLDLMEVLWENIVLEVPIRVTNSKEPNIRSGNGWEVRDENSKKIDPRLECFRTLLDEGKE